MRRVRGVINCCAGLEILIRVIVINKCVRVALLNNSGLIKCVLFHVVFIR